MPFAPEPDLMNELKLALNNFITALSNIDWQKLHQLVEQLDTQSQVNSKEVR